MAADDQVENWALLNVFTQMCIQMKFVGHVVSVRVLPTDHNVHVCLHMFVYSVSYTWSFLMSCLSFTRDVSVSGQKVLAMAREAGADITDAVSKCAASTSKEKRIEKDVLLSHSLSYWLVEVIHMLSGVKVKTVC